MLWCKKKQHSPECGGFRVWKWFPLAKIKLEWLWAKCLTVSDHPNQSQDFKPRYPQIYSISFGGLARNNEIYFPNPGELLPNNKWRQPKKCVSYFHVRQLTLTDNSSIPPPHSYTGYCNSSTSCESRPASPSHRVTTCTVKKKMKKYLLRVKSLLLLWGRVCSLCQYSAVPCWLCHPYIWVCIL